MAENMTGAITGELVGDAADQGLKKTNDIMRQHQEQGQYNTQKTSSRIHTVKLTYDSPAVQNQEHGLLGLGYF